MAIKVTFPPEKPVPIREQIAFMKLLFPNFQTRWRKNLVTWIGEVQPDALSDSYRVKITYGLQQRPIVSVLKPALQADEHIPHLYRDSSLCLYRPSKGEWTHRRHIATTIVPWTVLWLYYYEIWQATKEWRGGGEHPDQTNVSRQTNFQHIQGL
ncbi:hypothetical protein ACQ4M3_00325 [Leptolyngbya sp. AN03gr2]|uniref:hypothetical protein n=1 Tax=unclassified Leptolyngbya TaxID=2650499 RepID=UPI003D31C46E